MFARVTTLGALSLLASSIALAEETRRVEGLQFDRILVMGSHEVEITQGDAIAFQMRGDADDLAREPFRLKGSTLVLGESSSGYDDLDDIQFRITVTDIDSLRLKGSGEVYVKPLTVEEIYLEVQGSGEMKLFQLESGETEIKVSGSGDVQVAELKGRNVSAVLSGSGDIHFGTLEVDTFSASLNGSGDISIQTSGTANLVESNIVGSGDMDLSKLVGKTVNVNVVGSGGAEVHAEEDLIVNIMGSGDVEYGGAPTISQNILGSGDISKAN